MTSASGTCDVALRLRALIASEDMVAFPSPFPPFPRPDMMTDRSFRGKRQGVLRFAVVNTANYEKGGIKAAYVSSTFTVSC